MKTIAIVLIVLLVLVQIIWMVFWFLERSRIYKKDSLVLEDRFIKRYTIDFHDRIARHK